MTASTYLKKPFFTGAKRLEYLCDQLLSLADKYQWQLQAWAVFPNHYHFVGLSPSPLYPWCSAGWFQHHAENSFYKRIMQMKIDRVNVENEFEVDSRDV